MTKISQYQVDTNISANDQLIGSDAENSNLTKKFTVGDLSAYINGQSPGSPGSGTVTSISGTGTVSGITLSGTVTSSGNLTLGGALEIDPADITSAIGYVPYDASNPDGYTSFDGNYNSLTNKPTIYNEPGIFSGGGTPTLAPGVTAEEIRNLIGAGIGEGSGTVTSVNATAGTGISISGAPITTSGTIEITNTAPDTGVPAILSNGSVPTLNSGITAEEIRTLIGAGTGEMNYFSISAGVVSDFITQGNTIRFDGENGIDIAINPVPEGPDYIRFINTAPNVSTNLSTTTSSTTVTVVSSDGNNATLPAATTSLAGVMTASDKSKLDGFSGSADYVQNSSDTFTSSAKITQIITLTQVEYDGITPNSSFLYIIVD